MRFSEDQLAELLCSDRVKRPIHIWAPEQPRAVILAVHGGMAHAGDFVTPGLFFRSQGMATVSFDMHGHDGRKRVDIPSFECLLDDVSLFLQWVKRSYPGLPIFVMGHSMGALIASHLELGHAAKDRDIRGVILSSPYYVNAVKVPRVLLWSSDALAMLLPTMKVPLESVTDLLAHDPVITARHHADEQDNVRASEVTSGSQRPCSRPSRLWLASCRLGPIRFSQCWRVMTSWPMLGRHRPCWRLFRSTC